MLGRQNLFQSVIFHLSNFLHSFQISRLNQKTEIINKTKIISSLLLELVILFSSGCWISNAGANINRQEQRCVLWEKSALGFDNEGEIKFHNRIIK